MASTDQRTGFHIPWPSAPGDDAPTEPTADHAAEPDVEQAPLVPDRAEATANGRKAASHTDRLMADLVRAMRTAAEESRTASLDQLRADAEAQVERLRTSAADAAVEAKHQADEDIAEIRDWSKAEIARIRSETDARIEGRKQELEADGQAAAEHVERQVAAVQERVKAFEAEMAAFFDGLGSIGDPSAFAAAAARLPEPPPLDNPLGTDPASSASAATAPAGSDTQSARVQDLADAEAQAATESLEGLNMADEAAPPEGSDPADADAGSDMDVLAEGTLAARLAFVTGAKETMDPSSDTTGVSDSGVGGQTRLVVVGLINVSSIASFKRQLASQPGVQEVRVSSGPEGEFIFKVEHDPELPIEQVVTSLPGFAARVTASGDGTISVAARDPELHD
jgi:hypothetical protein